MHVLDYMDRKLLLNVRYPVFNFRKVKWIVKEFMLRSNQR